jgi:hypothetical protein
MSVYRYHGGGDLRSPVEAWTGCGLIQGLYSSVYQVNINYIPSEVKPNISGWMCPRKKCLRIDRINEKQEQMILS